MGKLVTFDKRRLDKRSPNQPSLAGEAEILIFTGVRYERAPVEPGKPPASAGSAGSTRKRG